MPSVHFFTADLKAPLQNRARLKRYIKNLFKTEEKCLDSLSYIFCTDEYLLTINKQFLQHDFYTDIITFDLSFNNQATTGEIYISIDRVKDNAHRMGVTVKEELHRVIFHGALHLCGYEDKTVKARKKMTQKEDYYIFEYFK